MSIYLTGDIVTVSKILYYRILVASSMYRIKSSIDVVSECVLVASIPVPTAINLNCSYEACYTYGSSHITQF